MKSSRDTVPRMRTERSPRSFRKIALLYCAGLLLFLELSSALVLTMINDTRLERFDALLLADRYKMVPHPYLGWVSQGYLRERERYLSLLAVDNRTGKIVIAALGGSTTETGWPRYMEEFLNSRLAEANSSLRVSVFNFGVPGWSSLQSLLNYVYLVRYAHPDFIVVHHNINDRSIDTEIIRQSVLYYPLAGPMERTLLRHSRTYKLSRFAYLYLYNHFSYGCGVYAPEDKEPPPHPPHPRARLSSYLNWPRRIFMPSFFSTSLAGDAEGPRMSHEGVLTEIYDSFIRYSRADGSTLILTTQYLNYSKSGFDPSDEPAVDKEISRSINTLLRNVSSQHRIPLVDLAAEMEPYDELLSDDGVHFGNAGSRVIGELVGQALYPLITEVRPSLSPSGGRKDPT